MTDKLTNVAENKISLNKKIHVICFTMGTTGEIKPIIEDGDGCGAGCVAGEED